MNMRTIFFPDHMYNYFLFPTRFASIVITHSTIRATVVRAHRNQRFIEQFIEQPIAPGEVGSIQERTNAALQLAISSLPPRAIIISVLPSTQVIFKIITVPLMSLTKIKMIVPFEIETSLPFAVSEADIDCIIVEQNKNSKTAQILVAAVKHTRIEEHLALYTTASRQPDIITTDAIALYALYAGNCPMVPAIQGTVVLLNIEEQHTTIVLGTSCVIQSLRILPINNNHALGIEQIVATITSFFVAQPQQTIPTIVLCGSGIDSPEFKEFSTTITQRLHAPCMILPANKIVHSSTIHSSPGLTNNFLIPVAAALPEPLLADFNLNQMRATQGKQRLITSQIIAAAVLALGLFTLFGVARFIALRAIRTEIIASERETIETLKSRLHLNIPKSSTTSLDAVNNMARADVINKETIWFSIFSPNRFSPLRILEELSKRINRDELGLYMQRISISEDSEMMILEGSVKNFTALRKLEEDLRQSLLFKNISNLQDLNFNAKVSLDLGGGNNP